MNSFNKYSNFNLRSQFSGSFLLNKPSAFLVLLVCFSLSLDCVFHAHSPIKHDVKCNGPYVQTLVNKHKFMKPE